MYFVIQQGLIFGPPCTPLCSAVWRTLCCIW